MYASVHTSYFTLCTIIAVPAFALVMMCTVCIHCEKSVHIERKQLLYSSWCVFNRLCLKTFFVILTGSLNTNSTCNPLKHE